MEVSKLIKQYLKEGRVMQLATVSSGQPWICSVYYVADDKQNLYWLSLPFRRHSQEIEKHAAAAAAIPIKTDQPVIGMQIEGEAEVVSDTNIAESVMERYVAVHGVGNKFYDNFKAGKNQHKLYRIKPRVFVLFDEVNFSSDNSRQEWRV